VSSPRTATPIAGEAPVEAPVEDPVEDRPWVAADAPSNRG